MTSSQRVLVLWAVAIGLFVIVASAEAPPRTGCGARAYADSCVDACCAWCPATAANMSVIALARSVHGNSNDDSDDSGNGNSNDKNGGEIFVGANGSAAATAKGSCHERGRAPCGPNAIMRPASECYIELVVSIGSVFGVIALAMAACYARRRWMRRRAARAKVARQRPKNGRMHSSHHRTLTMIDIPYAQSADGTLVYYASPYAVARDVEYATVLIDEEGGDDGDDGTGVTGCSPCRRAR
ncbi:hypothetical protein pqer_cds_804 [Pandoravirus quercus]|uniref:Uncharacterized protein n=2 Tax=Pandoravirus TaxID=2060084 RepID=A0A2U7U9W9_9VIRU|nr:hypothetical protein pqer_cds_804 [Pandoravirus quercus]AVK75226.1 hypothetical protein pqer_cds_804 [Pandoravirus quercus]QBZ81397.1 hypothetical protein pclt_cds_810 [Pandoravirus celtis]